MANKLYKDEHGRYYRFAGDVVPEGLTLVEPDGAAEPKTSPKKKSKGKTQKAQSPQKGE